jgi:hypothetical protein
MAVTDINGDAIPDLVPQAASSHNGVGAAWDRGGSFAARKNFPTVAPPNAATGDVNGDQADIVVVEQEAGAVLLNTGVGNSARPQTLRQVGFHWRWRLAT